MTALPPDPTSLVDPGLHADGAAHEVWRWMRRYAPVYRHAPTHLPAFWSLTRYEDVRAAYRDPLTFSSARGVLLRPTASRNDPGAGLTLALTDPPRHRQLRAVVAEWFTARSVRELESSMHAVIRAVLERALDKGECDFVHDVAGRLSIYTIGHMMGVPKADHEALFLWTNEAFEVGVSLAAHQELMRYFVDLMERRAVEPGEDLVSMLLGGTVEGELLTEEEILLNCENLVGATENGRLSLASGMSAFLENPDQWERLRDDRELLAPAVEEILRWTSSATHSMRSATASVELHGQRIQAGDWVVLWVPSANRDESVFADPFRFDIARRPNRHLALASGEHFCLGATLARAQTRILFSELLELTDKIEDNGPPVPVRSIAVNGPEHLPIRIIAK